MKHCAGTLFLLLALAQQSFASHIVGGELTYRCLGNNRYEITLTIYRDCFNGIPPFDNPAIIGVYRNGNDTIFQKVKIPYDPGSNDTLPVLLDNPCLILPPNVCVHKATYQDTLDLPYRPEGYTIVYQSCCRNGQTRNVPIPLNTGISFVANITGLAQLECNNAATFNRWPPVGICIHRPIDFDHSASDLDGDSLRYRLCTPFNGPDSLHSVPDPPAGPPFQELTWIDPPYNLQNMLGGSPLAIDSLTGFMTGIPNTLGSFVVGVCLDEFREGVLISTTRRDFQYNVTSCSTPTAAFFVPATVCDTLQVAFQNQSISANDYQWHFDWLGDPSQMSDEFSPVHIYPDTGTYTVALVVEPGTVCRDTFFAELFLTDTDGTLVLSATPNPMVIGTEAQLTAQLPGASAFQWTPAGSLSDAEIYNPVATPGASTIYAVTATLPNGCEKTGMLTLAVIPPPCASPYVFLPTGFSPNGDGQNDVLQLESSAAIEVNWVIYNRWGEKVFEANSLEDAWDGSFRGVPQPAETYGFHLRVRCSDGQEMVEKGNVTLLR